jgi:hypothetical protein
MKKLALTIPMDSSGGADTGGGLIDKPTEMVNVPQSTKNVSTRLEIPDDTKPLRSPASGSSFSFREQSSIDYLMNRDPM